VAYGRLDSATNTLPTAPRGHPRFTGQKEDATGLYYYNARYYDPALGTFISADSLIPDPNNFWDYNRYMYVRGNPLRYNDPSGHIAICFQGGAGDGAIHAAEPNSDQNSVQLMCQQALGAAGYNAQKHGQILYLNNGVNSINYAYEQVLAAKAANANEPVIIIGYSWGGAAALDLVDVLNSGRDVVLTLEGEFLPGAPVVPVDLLFLVDPEPDFRRAGNWVFPNANARNSPNGVSSNVRTAVNIYAEKVNLNAGVRPLERLGNYEWGWQNGLNNVKGALNVGLSDVVINGNVVPMTHGSIMYGDGRTLNPSTQAYMTRYIFGALWGFMPSGR
jgi:RHS repeat-associated protein